jgi:protein-glutamine gamma-glutamyltransferase
MNVQRAIAVVMILVSSLLIVWVSGDIAFPAILSMLGLLGLHGRFSWGLRPEKRFVTPLLLLLLAVLFSLHCGYAAPSNEKAAAFAWQTIARYFLASMILILFLRPRERPGRPASTDPAPLSPSLGLFHLGSAVAAGQVLLLDDRYVTFRLVELVSVTLVVLYASCRTISSCIARRASKGGKPFRAADDASPFMYHALYVPILILAVNFGWIGGSILYGRAQALNLLSSWIWRVNVALDPTMTEAFQVGFSTSGRLSGVLEIMEDANPDPVLRITSNSSPGYLRASTFDQYMLRQSEWSSQASWDTIPGVPDSLLGRMYSFRLNEREPGREMTIRHESLVVDAMFMPLGTCSIEAPFTQLMHNDSDGIVRPLGVRKNLAYHVYYSPSFTGKAPGSEQLRRLTRISPQLDPQIRQLANKIFRGANTTSEKIDAVTRYFHTNYTYSLGLEVPLDQDKLTYFLLDASTGYCEYFASGAAILLRLVNVPTRYVTGFFVTERDEDGRTWVARNMHAHAWVEAWDAENRTWTIVEATPQEDLGGPSRADPFSGAGGGGLLLGRFVQAVYHYGLFGVLGWFFEVYSLQTAVAVSLAFFGGAAGLALLRRYKRRGASASLRAAHRPELAPLHRMLAAMDRKARSTGARRAPGETLHAFADRIRHLSQSPCGRAQTTSEPTLPQTGESGFADWYLAYAALRYRQAISPDQIERLRRLAYTLRATP